MKRMVVYWGIVLLLLFSIPMISLTGVFGTPGGQELSQSGDAEKDTPIFTPYQPSSSPSQSASLSAVAPDACALDSFQILNLTSGKVDTVSRLDYIKALSAPRCRRTFISRP